MKRKLLAVMLTAAISFGMLSGCGGNNKTPSDNETAVTDGNTATKSAGLDTSKEVELVMYVVSDRPAAQDAVDENLNKLLKEKINATLKINWIPWADFANKYPLLFSSGEQFDLAYTSNWLNFSSLARKGAFKSLDELWPAYAPSNFGKQSETALQQAALDGKYYCVPTLLATYNAYGPIYRTDIMKGTSWDGKMETFEDIEEYCDIVKQNNPELEPIDIFSSGSEWDDTYMYAQGYKASKGSTNDFLFFKTEEAEPKLVTYYEMDETDGFLEIMTRWNEKGYYTKSALSDTDSTKTQNGKAAVRTHNIDTFVSYALMQPEWGFEYANFVSQLAHMPFTQDGMVISNTSKNPERAMAFWDLVTNDQEIYDALFYGILGTTYELDEKGDYKIIDTNTYATNAMWAARTTELNRNASGTPDSYRVQKEGFETAIVDGEGAERYAGFTIDTSAIETEYGACQSVHQQYWWPLELGYTPAESGLKEYKAKMEAAGIEKVREELQRQLDAYTAGLSQ